MRERADDRPPPRVWRVVLFFLGVVLVWTLVDVMTSSGPEDELVGSRFWGTLAIWMVLGAVIGWFVGFALRRRHAWVREPMPHLRALSRRQRLRVNLDLQRARLPRDPALAEATVEWLEFAVRMLPEQRRRSAVAIRVVAWAVGLLSVALAVGGVMAGLQGEPDLFWVAVIFAGLAFWVTFLPRWHDRLTASREALIESMLAFSRVLAEEGRDPDGVT